MKHLHRCTVALTALIASLSLTIEIHAQSDYGSIVGFVKDTSGGVISKTRVVVQNEATGKDNPTSTNESGYYVAASLPAGYYTVTAEAPGFKRFESTHNKLDPNSTLSLDVTLTIGATNETVEVVASATPLQTESSAVQNWSPDRKSTPSN